MAKKLIDISLGEYHCELDIDSYRFYYGHEQLSPEKEWKFVIWKKKNEVYTKIVDAVPKLPEKIDRKNPKDVLIYCLGGWMIKQEKTLSELIYGE